MNPFRVPPRIDAKEPQTLVQAGHSADTTAGIAAETAPHDVPPIQAAIASDKPGYCATCQPASRKHGSSLHRDA